MHRLVTVTRADRVVAYEHRNETWADTETDLTGRWPTISPTGDRYSLSVVDTVKARSRLELRDFETHELIGTPYVSEPGGPAAIAPRVPHYASWSPDGRYLSYVVPTAAGLTLFFANSEHLDVPTASVVGSPLFSAWLPDSSALVLHHAAEVSLVDPASGIAALVSDEAIGFRAPATTRKPGVYAYARRVDGTVALIVTSPEGEKTIATYETGVVFSFRPDHDELTVATTADPSAGVFNRLEVVEVATGEARTLWRSPYVAYWWHPDGQRVVILVPTQMGDGRYALYCLDPQGGMVTATPGFIPSEDTRLALGFFDQYAQSISPWDSTGEHFAISGRHVVDGVSSSFGDPVGDMVMLWSAEPNTLLAPIGAGGIAGFSPSIA